jgi:hypothetical protein
MQNNAEKYQEVYNYILELTQNTSVELMKIYSEPTTGKRYNRKTKFIIPKYNNSNNKDFRISEQEARFVFINLHDRFSFPGYRYSIETPTKNVYQFSGTNSRSAQSDLSFFDEENQLINIEFKAHNAPKESIEKDFEKLIKEEYYGAWIHIIKNENTNTIETLFDKYKNCFNELFTNSNDDLPNKILPISFHIIILKKNILLSKKGIFNCRNYNNFFEISFNDWNTNKIQDQIIINDWQIDNFSNLFI